MRTLLLSLVLVGCGSSSNNTPPADAPPGDTATVALDCASYCTEVQANCTGTNAQYPDAAHCMAACGSFMTGALTDMTMNTLGCRIYHAGAPAKSDPVTHCPHAGPGGDLTSVVTGMGTCGNACSSFCKLEIMACGTTTSAPTTGQYADMNACQTACQGFANPTHKYVYGAAPNVSGGDSLACRLAHATNAAISGNAMTHCKHTGPAPADTGDPCLAGMAATP